MLCLVLSLFLLLGGDTPPPELDAAVKDYWGLMAKPDKFGALKHVLKGSENNFIALHAPSIRSWKVAQIQMRSATEAEVMVETVAWSPGALSFQTRQASYTWIHDGTSWKVLIPKPGFRIDPTLPPQGAAEKKPLAPELRVSPETVKIPFLNTVQKIRIKVANGTPKPALLDRVELDEKKFELTDRPTAVDPGQSVHMTLHYTGNETAKDLKSSLTLVFKHDDQERVFRVPILYNYLSLRTRQFFGLSGKAAEQLKRGDKLTPVVKPPGTRNSKPAPRPSKPPAG